MESEELVDSIDEVGELNCQWPSSDMPDGLLARDSGEWPESTDLADMTELLESAVRSLRSDDVRMGLVKFWKREEPIFDLGFWFVAVSWRRVFARKRVFRVARGSCRDYDDGWISETTRYEVSD